MKEILHGIIWRYMVGCGFILLGKSDPPPSPDYAGAATATAAGNLDAARAASAANRVNQVTPYGNLTYTHDTSSSFDQAGYDAAYKNYQTQQAQQASQANKPNNAFGNIMGGNFGQQSNSPSISAPNRADFTTNSNPDGGWTATQTLSPAEQSKLDQNNALSNSLLGTAQKGLNGVDTMLTNGFDFNALPKSAVDAGQTGQDAIMARLNPQFAQSEEALRTRLVNQGVRAGSQAWDNEFRNFNSGKNDAYSQAALQGIGVGQQARQQALQEQEFGRTEGLNMVNALRTGNQVTNPTFSNVPQQATTAGADLLGAAGMTGQYNTAANNASNASSAGLFGGLAQLGSAALSGGTGSLASKMWSKF